MTSPIHPTSYLSPRLEARAVAGKGFGVFAREPLRQGDLLLVWGGEVHTGDTLYTLSTQARSLGLQIHDDLYLVPTHVSDADRLNHSCAPNAGLYGQIVVVAMRDIAAGEEVCYDYAMTDTTPYDEFECHCGAPACRGRVTGNDWRRPELWARYAGYFSPYVQRKIDALRAERAADAPR